MYVSCHLVSLSCNSDTYLGDSKRECSEKMPDYQYLGSVLTLHWPLWHTHTRLACILHGYIVFEAKINIYNSTSI